MVKTTMTLTIDHELKQKAIPIIQNEWKRSISSVFQEVLEKIIEENRLEKK